MSASLNDLLPEFAPIAREFVDQVGAIGLQPRVTSTLRTRSQQERLYREYLRGGRGFPVAPPGTSAHEYGFAFDMVVSPMESLRELGAYWQSIGGFWSPSDAIHFQYPGFTPPRGGVTDQSTFESLVSLFLPTGLSIAQLFAETFPDVDPDVAYALLHPWTGLDWMVPDFLLEWRKRLLGV